MRRLIALAAVLSMFGSIAPAHPHEDPVIREEPKGPDRPMRPLKDVWV